MILDYLEENGRIIYPSDVMTRSSRWEQHRSENSRKLERSPSPDYTLNNRRSLSPEYHTSSLPSFSSSSYQYRFKPRSVPYGKYTLPDAYREYFPQSSLPSNPYERTIANILLTNPVNLEYIKKVYIEHHQMEEKY